MIDTENKIITDTKPKKVGDDITLDTMDVVLSIPIDTCAVELTCVILQEDNTLLKVHQRISAASIYKAREDYLRLIGFIKESPD